jgi:hypothetical protein
MLILYYVKNRSAVFIFYSNNIFTQLKMDLKRVLYLNSYSASYGAW